MNRTVRRAATALSIMTFISAVPGYTRAVETTAAPVCPPGNACLWTDAAFTGLQWHTPANTPILPSIIDNQASSAANGSLRCTVHLWAGPNYTGLAHLELGIGDVRNLSHTDWDNVISSVSFC